MSTLKRHEHWFALLTWNFGEFGRQDVHVHPCLWEDAEGEMPCNRVVIGPGRKCDGDTETHWRETL